MPTTSPQNPSAATILVLGPARSGKSEWAEYLAKQSQQSVIYIATARTDPADLEWQARIQQHRQRRPANWQTQEVPWDLAATIQTTDASTCLLVDSLGTWLTNGLEQDDEGWNAQGQSLLNSLHHAAATVILVAEEVGWGIVPAYPIGRKFRDRMGALVRSISALADTVYLVAGGHALNLSQLAIPLPTQTSCDSEDVN